MREAEEVIGADGDFLRLVQERLDALPDEEGRELGWMVVDRMPDGANSAAGPDEGMSTTNVELAEWLDRRALEAASHPWHAEHAHWTYELHDTEEATRYLRVAA